MDTDTKQVIAFVALFCMLIGGAIQYMSSGKPKYTCINNVLHERMSGTEDVYVTTNMQCVTVK